MLPAPPREIGAQRLALDQRCQLSSTFTKAFYGDVDDVRSAAASCYLAPDPPLTPDHITTTPRRWGSVPRSYIVAERAVAIRPALQRWFIAASDAEFPDRQSRVFRLDSDQSPFLGGLPPAPPVMTPVKSLRTNSGPREPIGSYVTNAFINKLSAHALLPAKDIASLEQACSSQKSFPARQDLIREGDKPGPIFVILDGWACRYKLLPEGSRQITAFLMPGDCCDLHASVLNYMEHSIATITPARVAMVPRPRMEELITTRPAITRAFWWAQLVDEDTLRAWIVSMGRRGSVERVAHLMCELYVRARNVGLTSEGSFELPLTQAVLGDALGLTSVHVNRVLRKLRVAGIMELAAGSVIISDVPALAHVAGFDDNYLHRRVRAERQPI